MSNSHILIIGAGELGLAILHHLTHGNPATTKLTVLLRPATITSSNISKQTEIAALHALGVNLLPCDLAVSSVAQLSQAFAPFELVISCTGFTAGKGTQVKLARAVMDAKVKWYIPWQFGVDYDSIGRGSAQDLFDEQLDVRNMLRGQDGGGEGGSTEWIIISTGIFTSFLFEKVFGVVDIEEGVVRALGSWDTEISVTTPNDIGRMVKEIVLEKELVMKDEVAFVAGDTLTYSRLADIVDSVLARKLRREGWNVAYLTEELLKDPDDHIKKYQVVFAKGKGVAWDMQKTYNRRKRIELTSVEDWARVNLIHG